MAKRKADLFKEGKPSETEIDDLAGEIGAKWERLGCRLGIKRTVLNEIKTNANDKPKEMLLRWIDTTNSTTPYEELYNAMCHGRVGCNNLAKEFCCVKQSPAAKSRKTFSDKGKTGATMSKQQIKKVKIGNPSKDVLQHLAYDIHTEEDSWKRLADRLKINTPKITAIDSENKGLFQKAHSMLLHWKQANGSDATYQVLFDALTDRLVSCRELAEEYCCEN